MLRVEPSNTVVFESQKINVNIQLVKDQEHGILPMGGFDFGDIDIEERKIILRRMAEEILRELNELEGNPLVMVNDVLDFDFRRMATFVDVDPEKGGKIQATHETV